MRIFYACHSETGPVREGNQDALLIRSVCTRRGHLLLAALCDGVGGLSFGELASAHTVRRLDAWFEKVLIRRWEEEDIDLFTIGSSLQETLQEINFELWQFGQDHVIRVGTTLTLFLLLGDLYYLFQVGDSRCYCIGGGEEVLLTRDQLVPDSHMLSQSIGANISVKPELNRGKVCPGRTYLLCCDGFWRKQEKGELVSSFAPDVCRTAELLKQKEQEVCELLMERGETDNLSVLAICLSEEEEDKQTESSLKEAEGGDGA